MGWFSKSNRSEPDAPRAADIPSDGVTDVISDVATHSVSDGAADDDPLPARPQWRALTGDQRAALDAEVAAVAARGADHTDLQALGRALDAAMDAWYAVPERNREDYTAVTHRWGVALGAYLAGATDLQWGMVTDVYGTDLGLMGARDDMVIVPQNLVSARWLNHQTGWVPGVLGHLVTLRTR
ncbi:MAG: DUF3806 domain-containing protein [Actinomycetales bacterium]|nr:DUF3806 domain-containing protein [Actinomycetales bacterium]